MKVVTWNVNSIRTRTARLAALLDRHEPDVVLLQETKVVDEGFPAAEVEALGYHAAAFGQSTYNGVALLSREPWTDVLRGFPGDPLPREARVLSARAGGFAFVNAYVINGRSVDDPMYRIKLEWLDAFAEWIESAFASDEPLIVAGDFNIARDDRDVHDPELYQDRVHASGPERIRLNRLLDWGLTDLLRIVHPEGGIYSWWDHRAGAFHRGWGMRIDLILGTEPVASRVADVFVDRDERKSSTGEGKPSDHAPVIAVFE